MSQDPYRYFRVEARELLEQLGQGVLELERAPPPPELVPRLLRFAHTLKGAARVVKQTSIAELAHAVEDALAPLRDRGDQVSSESVDAILKQLDSIAAQVAVLVLPTKNESVAPAPAEQTLRTVRTDVAEMDALLDGLAQASVRLGDLRKTLHGVEHARRLTDRLAERTRTPKTLEGVGPATALASVGAKALSEELRSTVFETEQTLGRGLDQLEREIRQVRESAERLRLVPASSVFAPLTRIARDSAQSIGRRVEFETVGGDVRLDAHVLSIVQDALVQLVRNAVAHGIEPEPERLRAGKLAAGRITVEVTRRGNRVGFVCGDDGRGVDLEEIRRVAQRKGLATSTDAHDAAGLISLLLRGGLTTADTVTDVSGRGVGLDVVRDCATRLGGEVLVRTDRKRGTQVELVVPVSLSSLDALVMEASGVMTAIPRDRVLSTVRMKSEDVARTTNGESIVHEGKAIPFIPLARALRVTEIRSGPRTWTTVVIGDESASAAIGVDRVLTLANVILRPLPALAPTDMVVAGISLDPEGNPQIVLDAEALVAAAAAPTTRIPDSMPDARPPILVIDDSLTTRMLERSILESSGYDVTLAVSAEDGLEIARTRRFGLFLVDVEMPGISGFEFIERVRADPAMHDIPAILVTSCNTPADRQRGTAVGADGYVVKSEFDQGKLVELIGRLVG